MKYRRVPVVVPTDSWNAIKETHNQRAFGEGVGCPLCLW
jgi:hypothetical protein